MSLEASQICRHQRTWGTLASITLHHTHAHTPTHTHSLSVICPITPPLPAPSFLSFFLLFFSCFGVFFFPALMTHSGIMKLLRGVWSRAETKGKWVGGVGRRGWGCKVTLRQSTIFTMCLFNTRPIYSCQIFSLCPPHTGAPSQAWASNGSGGLTPVCAAKGNTPYPLACSSAHPKPFSLSPSLFLLQPPSTLHSRIQVQDIPSSPFTVRAMPFLSPVSHRSLPKMKGEKRDLSFCRDLPLLLKKGRETGRAGEIRRV